MQIKIFIFLLSCSSLFSYSYDGSCNNLDPDKDILVSRSTFLNSCSRDKPQNTIFCSSPDDETATVYSGCVYSNSCGGVKSCVRSSYGFKKNATCPEGEEIYNAQCVPKCEENEIRNEYGICEAPPAPECGENEVYNTTLEKCLPIDDDINSTTPNIPPVSDLADTFFSDTPCQTVEEPNPYVPNGLTEGATTQSSVNVPECIGSYWKCNYSTGLYEKLTYTLTGEQCVLYKTKYDPVFNPETSEQFNTKSSPCDERIKIFAKVCGKDGFTGNCSDNGMFVTSENLKCIFSDETAPKDCSSAWHEVLNTSTNECECKEGFIRNTFGDCWKPLFPDDSNLTLDQQAQEQIAQFENYEAKRIEKANKENQEQENIVSTTTNNSLSGIRRDLNVSNSLLSSINSKLGNGASDSGNDSNSTSDDSLIDGAGLNGVDELLSDSEIYYDNWKGQFETFSENVNNQLSGIQEQYDNARSLFDSEKSFAVPSGSTNNCLSFNFNGKNITFDLCTSFALLSPIVYFVTTILFMVGTFRFMVNHLLKGLE